MSFLGCGKKHEEEEIEEVGELEFGSLSGVDDDFLAMMGIDPKDVDMSNPEVREEFIKWFNA